MCQATKLVPIDGILSKTPAGKIAMFVVVKNSADVCDEHLGESVYIHNGRVYDFMADEQIEGLKASDLRFDQYINR